MSSRSSTQMRPVKRPASRAMQRSDVENQAANLAQKLPADVVEAVGLAVEIVQVDNGHLREAARQKGQRLGGFAAARGAGFGSGIGLLNQFFVAPRSRPDESVQGSNDL